MPDSLLPLWTLHEKVRAGLSVVHDQDGDFEGAPPWSGPVRLEDGRYVSLDWLLRQPWDLEVALRSAAFDCRVFAVRDRLLRLCVQALDYPAEAAFVTVSGTPEAGFVALRAARGLSSDRRWIWKRETGKELSDRPAGLTLPPGCDEASATVALTLALAPRFKALEGA